jgi:hypothetical protein
MRRFIPFVLLICCVSDSRGQALPADLALVPGDGAGFVHLKTSDVLASPMFAELRWAFAGLSAEEWKKFEQQFSPHLSTFDRVLVILPTPESAAMPISNFGPFDPSAVVVVTCKEAFDAETFYKQAFRQFRRKSHAGRQYVLADDDWRTLSVLPDRKTFVFGAEDTLIELFEHLEQPHDGPLTPLRAEALKHTLFVGLNPAVAFPANVPPPFSKVTAARLMTLFVDLKDTFSLTTELRYADAAAAQTGEAGLQEMIKMGRAGLQSGIDQANLMANPANQPPVLEDAFQRGFAMLGIGALRQLDKLLATLPLLRKEQNLHLKLELPMPNSSTTAFFSLTSFSAVMTMGMRANMAFANIADNIGSAKGKDDPEAARRKKMVAAFEAYHAKHGTYPPAFSVDKNQQPLLSWRVHLLPYLGEEELYSQFKLDEPWDSRHNKRLLRQLPKCYKPNRDWRGPQALRVADQVFVGPDTLFEGAQGLPKSAVQTPPGQMALYGEFTGYNQGIYWTRPRDRKVTDTGTDADGYSGVTLIFMDGSFKTFNYNDADRNNLAKFARRVPVNKK